MNSARITSNSWDVIVVGAGAAGLMTCIELPPHLKILLLNRNTSKRSASRWAQGGIAAVTREEDSLQSHADDTFRAGCGLCDTDAVKMLVEHAPQCVERLQKLGMEFDRDSKGLATTLEAAHSHRRVLHVQDRTGRALVDVLREQVEKRSNIVHCRGVRVTQLLVEHNCCDGVQVLDGPLLYWIQSKAVVLASGGGGHLFANTTNPAQACGEGLALAWKAGAAIEDLEFFQFHPTALKLQGATSFLISEAVRGEGAVLVDRDGNSPVAHLLRKDLAPRDQVSRALVKTMQSQGVSHIGLDLMNIPPEKIFARFPSIIQRCREMGIDPLNNLIPVAPAAHYWMGGVATDMQAATSVSGLYAVGEVACTGVHGANRLASNSLLECLVFASQMSVINVTESSRKNIISNQTFLTKLSNNLDCEQSENDLQSSIEDLRKLFWKEVGVNRSKKGMQDALNNIRLDLDSLNKNALLELVSNQSIDICNSFDEGTRRKLNLLLDLNHRKLTCLLTLNACLFRTESRGGHYRLDSPATLPYWRCHSRQKKGQTISTRPVRE
ncbi:MULTISPECIES: L-aspartate oxidase [Prochlorococcus]|uniref:L-aspartate oxidase n=1 Tax=Prochlorococcus marinus (strain SARG / CCMP1375 / SS120) TaxID=167539 RepID=Q7VE94_PROMA|nr:MULTISPECIES: L-aspartate oxidase [Prochlorococcus]AAP99165.1 Aspartate oxidase [Prochlorococcus marinus subsp. marinus str. CCMP1375]KGG11565.1 L-aspartate oxidase [Prochlorococcus marinus str. LG]KGG18481.1 L-aspartate oxidase [Prochlorococcus marinus str. SS2]KGG22754.1 L-aspartate oxidase [Prochlorococcus marinus str. SS35]KGG32630.1 L-aspartate oxidase [Prochlorococcus marinus str. SS51]